MKFNKDIENIKSLMALYDNSTVEDKLNILEDLDFLLHQIDNARDFVSLGGLNKVILPALESLEISEENVLFGNEVTSEYIGSETKNSQTNSILS